MVSHFTFRVPEGLLPWHNAKCSWAVRPGLPSLFQEGLGLSNWWAQGHLMSRGPGPVSLWEELQDGRGQERNGAASVIA